MCRRRLLESLVDLGARHRAQNAHCDLVLGQTQRLLAVATVARTTRAQLAQTGRFRLCLWLVVSAGFGPRVQAGQAQRSGRVDLAVARQQGFLACGNGRVVPTVHHGPPPQHADTRAVRSSRDRGSSLLHFDPTAPHQQTLRCLAGFHDDLALVQRQLEPTAAHFQDCPVIHHDLDASARLQPGPGPAVGAQGDSAGHAFPSGKRTLGRGLTCPLQQARLGVGGCPHDAGHTKR